MSADAITAATARARYDAFAAEGRIVQSLWHNFDSEGRELACALGVIGPKVDSPKVCPASVKPL